jgi:hypothetical protein
MNDKAKKASRTAKNAFGREANMLNNNTHLYVGIT